MKKLTRILASLLCLVTLASAFALPASAKSVKSYSCQYTSSSSKGGSRYFYVKTGSSKSSRQIKLTMDRGYIQAKSSVDYKTKMVLVYGAYEIKVFKKSGESWTLEQDFDVYNKSSTTITCNSKNSTYKIQVYCWNPSTIFKSYHKNNVSARASYGSVKFQKFFTESSSTYSKISWYSYPSCKATPKSGCTLYDSKP